MAASNCSGLSFGERKRNRWRRGEYSVWHAWYARSIFSTSNMRQISATHVCCCLFLRLIEATQILLLSALHVSRNIAVFERCGTNCMHMDDDQMHVFSSCLVFSNRAYLGAALWHTVAPRCKLHSKRYACRAYLRIWDVFSAGMANIS